MYTCTQFYIRLFRACILFNLYQNDILFICPLKVFASRRKHDAAGPQRSAAEEAPAEPCAAGETGDEGGQGEGGAAGRHLPQGLSHKPPVLQTLEQSSQG